MASLTPFGVVLFRPELSILRQLLDIAECESRPAICFVNGLLSDDVETYLSTLTHVDLIRSETNLGQAVGLNAVCDRALEQGHTHIMLMDQDSTPSTGIVERALTNLTTVAADRPIAAVGLYLIPPKGSSFLAIQYPWRSGVALGDTELAPVDFLPTSGTLLDLDAFRKVGTFREDFFIGAVDVEWGFRAWSKGYASVVDRRLTMDHRWGEEHPSPDNGGPMTAVNRLWIMRMRSQRLYYHVRNSLICFGLPHFPLGWRLKHAATLTAKLLLRLTLKNSRRIDLRALYAAIAGVPFSTVSGQDRTTNGSH